MTISNLKKRFENLGENYKTADVDRLNRALIKEGADVSCLKDVVLTKQQFHRTYFQVSMGQMKTVAERLDFIENNFELLNDWWHVDQLTQFVGKDFSFDEAYERAKGYVMHPHPFARRWGYVMFMPKLVKGDYFDEIVRLFHDDEEYYVVMAEAWLISYLGIYHPIRTLEWLKTKPLKYNIVGRGIQKICDSYQIPTETKENFKSIRRIYK